MMWDGAVVSLSVSWPRVGGTNPLPLPKIFLKFFLKYSFCKCFVRNIYI